MTARIPASEVAEPINGVLLLYHHPPGPAAATVMEHVEAFERHSRFNVWKVNTGEGFPKALTSLEFESILLHYSLFGIAPYQISDYFLRYLAASHAHKIAFFQDEHHYCTPRFEFLNRYEIDCVYTLLEPPYWSDVYGTYTNVPKLVYTIPGYVSDHLVGLTEQITIPDGERGIDIGYRGRTLLPYMGRGAREKAEIGQQFAERARGSGLELDIAVDEASRIYADAWPQFLANCRGALGVEAGVSVFDLDDTVREAYEQLVARNPDVTFEEIEAQILAPTEGNIPYRTISPRHFEAAALRVCQILFEGTYSGVLEPMVHYIPLRKDFSNFDEVLRRFSDPKLRQELTENAYADLIASERFSYRRFVESFDAELVAAGLEPASDDADGVTVTEALERDRGRRAAAVRLQAALSYRFPGRAALGSVLKPSRTWYRRRRLRRWERQLEEARKAVEQPYA